MDKMNRKAIAISFQYLFDSEAMKIKAGANVGFDLIRNKKRLPDGTDSLF